MSNIYRKITIETFSKRRFSEFKKFVTKSVFEELQHTQISLNFKTSYCNLKIRDLGVKSSIYIEGARNKIISFFNCVLGGGSGWKENKKEWREPVH